jgi:hypothetical protein
MSQLPKLPIYHLLLSASAATNSYLFFFSVGDTQRGIIPLLNGRLGEARMSPEARVRAFSGYFKNAMV